MLCPRCGLPIADANTPQCPRCGQPLTAGVPSQYGAPYPPADGGSTSRPGPTASAPYSAEYGTPQPPYDATPGYTYPPQPGYGEAAPPSSSPYGQPTGAYGQPSQFGQPGTYGQPEQYGQPGQPSIPLYNQYGQPYGQAAPPTYPSYGQGQPGGYPGQQYGYGAPYPGAPGMPVAGVEPPKRGHTGLIVGGIVALVVILLIASAAVALSLIPTRHTSTAVGPGGVATQVAATAAPSPTPGETVVYQDSLATKNSAWPDGQHCAFGDGGYHVKENYLCPAPSGEQTDSTLVVQVAQISGDTSQFYGVGLRMDVKAGNQYAFFIDSNSEWAFAKSDHDNFSTLIEPKTNPAIHGGLNTVNTLKVVAQGTHFTLFVNDTQVGAYDDSSFASGVCAIEGAQNSEVVFTNFKLTRPS